MDHISVGSQGHLAVGHVLGTFSSRVRIKDPPGALLYRIFEL